ncbi:uncharacterized protein LOC135159584 [Lytechinus pictus]|uniref:uncharacterized protein LOC135159584 n=1 Tax=Lytechinus pictus TaxID=7653 RepID=UPI0030BA0B51
MVPIPGTLHPRVTPSPLEKIRPAGPLLPSPPSPAARSRWVPLPARPARGKSKAGPWPPRHPAHPGQTPDAASDGTHPGDPASPLDPLAAGRKTPPDNTAYNTQVNAKFTPRATPDDPTAQRRRARAALGKPRTANPMVPTAGSLRPRTTPFSRETVRRADPRPFPAVGRSDGQNLLPTPGWVSGGVGSACGALSARCVEICRSESSADARVGEREGRLGMRGAVGPLRRDLPVTISRHLLRG